MRRLFISNSDILVPFIIKPLLGNHGNKIQKQGTSPSVSYGNKIQTKIMSTWS